MIFGRQRAQQDVALALMDARINEIVAFQQRQQDEIVAGVDALRNDVASRDRAFVESTEQISLTCGRLFDDIEADRAERRSLLGALNRLALAFPPSIDTAPRFVAALPVDATVGDLVADEVAVTSEQGVEVRCRFGDRWVDGFEVCETLADDHQLRYRLRRRSDGSILPTLFEASDIRPPSTRSEQTERADQAARRWSLP